MFKIFFWVPKWGFVMYDNSGCSETRNTENDDITFNFQGQTPLTFDFVCFWCFDTQQVGNCVLFFYNKYQKLEVRNLFWGFLGPKRPQNLNQYRPLFQLRPQKGILAYCHKGVYDKACSCSCSCESDPLKMSPLQTCNVQLTPKYGGNMAL